MRRKIPTHAPDARPAKVAITRETFIPIGVAVAIMIPAIGGWTWLSRQLDSIDRRLERIELADHKTMSVEEFERRSSTWLFTFSKANPTLVVPELR